MLKGIAAGVGVLIAILALGWVVTGNEFFLYKVFAPKTEQVRRGVFEQSRAFNEGMVRELENLRLQYLQVTDPDAKAVLATTMLRRAAGYNLDDPIVPADLRVFVAQLKRERLGMR
ncbi:MAG: Uncharacterized protein G01um101429_747 [Parcubacteria group bacterium Gr01-1014_29]|nr:MAG: Uncharacterized protein G01um101429_747 [Parcubacteria group bacterium Gr01-1014_29]